MEPATAFRDDDGSWLFFEIGNVRLLTAFAPVDVYRGNPISLGWPSDTATDVLANVWLEASFHQINWSNEHFGAGHSRRFQPFLRAITYGSKKEEESMALDPPHTMENLRRSLSSALGAVRGDAQFVRLELQRIGEANKNLEFAFWARVGLPSKEVIAIPYGNTGVIIRTGDLQRRALEDIVAAFIAEGHLQRPQASDIRDMLRTVVHRLSPSNQGKAA